MGSAERTKIVIYIETGLIAFGLFLTAIFVVSTFIVEDMIVEAYDSEEQEGIRLMLGSIFTGIFVLMLGCSLGAAILTSVLKQGFQEKCMKKLRAWLIAHSIFYVLILVGGLFIILKDPLLYLGSIPTWILFPYQVWAFNAVNDFMNEIRFETREEFEVVEFDEEPEPDDPMELES